MSSDYDTLHPKKRKQQKLQVLISEEENIKNCVGCNHPVEKTGGCNLIKCKICKTKWCWVCHLQKRHCVQ